MLTSPIDLAIIGVFLTSVVAVGIAGMRRSSKNAEAFFLSGRDMPWWLLGVSMVACTFSCDTPNLVTDIVRNHGVAGNWVWWAFLLTGMLTAFVYAKLWRRSELSTDLGFYEFRYAGKPARALRGFRAIYLGVLYNIITMGASSLAAVKIGAVFFGASPGVSLSVALAVVGVYATLGGLTGSIWADFYQYAVAMVGAVAVAWFAVDACGTGGHGGTLADLFTHAAVLPKLSFLPSADGPGGRSALMTVFVLPIAVQWWAAWYPGAEPGGGGFVAQRMLAAKNERHAAGATLLFNFLHYSVRTWPWLLVALASLVVFPDLAAMKTAFPAVTDQYLRNDLAYPAMVSILPKGWLGLVVASLLAAYMSTIATQLNWGASYVVQDFYMVFVNRHATPRQQVAVARVSMVVLAVLGGGITLFLENSKSVFDLMLQVGAGTGLLYLLRWFWRRINAWSEISAMAVSFAVACYFQWGAEPLGLAGCLSSGWCAQWFDYSAWKLLLGVSVTTTAWLFVTFLTSPEPSEKIAAFESRVGRLSQVGLGRGILCTTLGCLAIWSGLFGVGWLLYALGGRSGATARGIVMMAVSLVAVVLLLVIVGRGSAKNQKEVGNGNTR